MPSSRDMSDEDVEFKAPLTVRPGQIQFVEACHPPLVAGDYAVRMRQRIQQDEASTVPWNSDPYATELRFTVDAPRFTLDPADIHSVYPPANQRGRYDNALPHVVFTRRTLPWERTLDGAAPQLGKPYAPWMGLLLLQDAELAVEDAAGQATPQRREPRSLPVFSAKADSLLSPQDPRVLPPDVGQAGAASGGDPAQALRAAAWQRDADRYQRAACLAIDLPASLFKALAPREEDLRWLAHVRQVDTGDKEVAAVNDKGWFSVAVCNRLPSAGTEHRVLLVSLEGHKARLQEAWQPAPGQIVRLAVLSSWSFTCEGSNDFKALLEATSVDTLRLPGGPPADDASPAAQIVRGALSRGYTASDHQLRHGERTVSWYRGPMVPLDHVKPAQVQQPVSGADELLRYDPDTGLFDASYAAAWQLGRLLALQNRSFAAALARLRAQWRHVAEREAYEAELQLLRSRRGLGADHRMADAVVALLARDTAQVLREDLPPTAPSRLPSGGRPR